MKFLYVAPRYHTNQIPIIRGLKRAGHEVCFLSQYAGKMEDYRDVTPVVVGYSPFFLFWDRLYLKWMGKRDAYAADRKIKLGFPPIGRLAGQIKKSGADVAILRERSVYSVAACLLCRRYHIPAILYNQSPLWEDRIKEDIPHRLMRRLTPEVRMTPVMGIWGENKKKEPGAVFVPFVMEPAMPPEEREERFSEGGVIRIFCIGKYEKRKNQQMLLEVLERLSPQYPLYLSVAGECTTDAHQAYYEGLMQYVRTHGLENRVTLYRNLNREQVEKQYRKADLFVIPSTREPASISQLEAMAFSLPVICSDANGTACYVENGQNGYLFRDNDKEALTEAVERIVSDPEKRRQMGNKSYRLVLEKYQIDAYLKGIEELLDRLKEPDGAAKRKHHV